ncbi:PadR family transcriptional regulator [Nocardia sp. XZ_19_385]|uniref:PadR family transcriptional regulator n=1 Tax=Nocardia sp. XZ_19_385 TaxID=2769488 RepID=UPI00188F0018|nr:helix-turn-helix transcriptional regulator [Nocardia sp. XZ_19_385]
MIPAINSHIVDGALLLLLAERADHGYSLLSRLEGLGIRVLDGPGALYRRLHALERKGLVVHEVGRSDKGPRRKIYTTTPLGSAALNERAISLRDARNTIDQWLHLHSNLAGLQGASR